MAPKSSANIDIMMDDFRKTFPSYNTGQASKELEIILQNIRILDQAPEDEKNTTVWSHDLRTQMSLLAIKLIKDAAAGGPRLPDSIKDWISNYYALSSAVSHKTSSRGPPPIASTSRNHGEATVEVHDVVPRFNKEFSLEDVSHLDEEVGEELGPYQELSSSEVSSSDEVSGEDSESRASTAQQSKVQSKNQGVMMHMLVPPCDTCAEASCDCVGPPRVACDACKLKKIACQYSTRGGGRKRSTSEHAKIPSGGRSLPTTMLLSPHPTAARRKFDEADRHESESELSALPSQYGSPSAKKVRAAGSATPRPKEAKKPKECQDVVPVDKRVRAASPEALLVSSALKGAKRAAPRQDPQGAPVAKRARPKSPKTTMKPRACTTFRPAGLDRPVHARSTQKSAKTESVTLPERVPSPETQTGQGFFPKTTMKPHACTTTFRPAGLDQPARARSTQKSAKTESVTLLERVPSPETQTGQGFFPKTTTKARARTTFRPAGLDRPAHARSTQEDAKADSVPSPETQSGQLFKGDKMGILKILIAIKKERMRQIDSEKALLQRDLDILELPITDADIDIEHLSKLIYTS